MNSRNRAISSDLNIMSVRSAHPLQLPPPIQNNVRLLEYRKHNSVPTSALPIPKEEIKIQTRIDEGLNNMTEREDP